MAGRLEARVEGREHFPPRGPVLVVARHYHHLYDGCLLVAAAPRPLRLMVALDWVGGPWSRRGWEALCAWAKWPVVLRAERLSVPAGAYRPEEASRYLRRGFDAALALLAAGEALAVFPEAYPVVDPNPTPRRGETLLPFRRGFASLAMLASRRLGIPIPVVPAGLAYDGRCVSLAFGSPLTADPAAGASALVGCMEAEVRRLSGLEARR
ncbi:MAG: 1-acyl-sn-glycerol-3-phosphate acyltransferase [Candidatus Dormibacteraeota bacterium]|uniref:1-acyl-sn-glycerol-3-phosphate acyltransferase n=1 Tax=Candidatus Nephthysia bennettiae TaxID=3127016 RepID=A0A934N843_9BACT|nr:1-acyl-sn-glycerol-3-phosphate acyltransferase [Candidatus Dormibacteraeota bacterium]